MVVLGANSQSGRIWCTHPPPVDEGPNVSGLFVEVSFSGAVDTRLSAHFAEVFYTVAAVNTRQTQFVSEVTYVIAAVNTRASHFFAETAWMVSAVNTRQSQFFIEVLWS